jgi:transcriptional regulator
MYVPGPNAVDDAHVTLELLRSVGVGHLVSLDATGEFDATVLPFLVDDDLTVIRAHIARANPQWRALDDATAFMVVPVSDAYVSPSWYPSKRDDPRVVPTWNYEVVHVHGTVHVRDDATFVESVVRSLTDHHEARRGADSRTDAVWSVDDAPPEFVARQLRAIVGIEIAITRVQAKRKLSQNRSDLDRRGVIGGLDAAPDRRSQTVADVMRADLTDR